MTAVDSSCGLDDDDSGSASSSSFVQTCTSKIIQITYNRNSTGFNQFAPGGSNSAEMIMRTVWFAPVDNLQQC
ncbi:hypothetical protein OS493_003230 [Desmophyllum pertusum]|uniref:Uncharacterized protein n=1 Tax=Desmophyllum pertusum TaxID=174260 RepID=A0A9W9YGP5_9CNID|nr:hypothetical protein OS493_003230 [Desmophyllum pertusum]